MRQADKNIAVLSGDGIGPEVINEAIKILNVISEKTGNENKKLNNKRNNESK